MKTATAAPSDASAATIAKHPIAVLVALGFSSLCASLMQSLVIPIQPALPHLLNTSASNAAWVVTATLLGGAVAMPIAGRLADIWGRKRVLVASAIILLVGSVICAPTNILSLVLIGRVLQGLAMGYIPVAISLAREAMPPAMRNTAVASISATLGVGGALGLPIAAWIAETFNWHALFWLAVVLAVAVAVLSATVLPTGQRLPRVPFDIVGAVGLTIGISAVLVAVSKGSDWGWASPSTLLLLVGGVAVLLVWGAYELRRRHPLVDLRPMARRPVLLTNIAAVLMGFGMMAQAIVVPQLLELPVSTELGMGQTVIEAGLWMAPAGLMMLLFSPVSSRMLTVFGGRITLAVGGVVLAGGYVFALFLMDAPWQIMLATCIASAGIGIGYAAMPTIVMNNLPASEAGSGVGVNSLARSLGTTAAGAVMGVILTTQVTELPGGTAIPTSFSFQLCFVVAALAALAAVAVTLCIKRRTPVDADEPLPTTGAAPVAEPVGS